MVCMFKKNVLVCEWAFKVNFTIYNIKPGATSNQSEVDDSLTKASHYEVKYFTLSLPALKYVCLFVGLCGSLLSKRLGINN